MNKQGITLLQPHGEDKDKRALPHGRELMAISKDIMLQTSAIVAVG